jgi:2-C-methyl-D-erythritol 4-phosphate cytidylyltransferase/2-C-methyl-D-erythritol 2,4-cyclodiphosphate synthase
MSDTVKRELREGLAGRPAPAGQGETGAIGELAVVAETVDRNGLWTVQTPQVVRVDWYEEALRQARASGLQASDEAGLLETAGFPVRLIPGERTNIKVTVPEDLELAEAILALRQGRRAWSGEGQREEQRGEGDMEVRVGLGTDVHRLVGGRPLVLGGVTIPFDLGLAGHSDADVLTHAVIDACLGAAGLGDIGRHFPDTDPRWKGANSLALLRQVRQLLQANGWLVVNVDTVVSAQRPKLAPYADAIVSQLAAALGIDKMQMNFKAKTGEGLGWVGTGEGMAAEAVVLLQRGTAGGLRR